MHISEVEELVLEQGELTTEEVYDILGHSPENEEKNPSTYEPSLSIKYIVEIINSIQNAMDKAFEKDPIMLGSIRFKHDCEKAIMVYKELYKDYIRRSK